MRGPRVIEQRISQSQAFLLNGSIVLTIPKSVFLVKIFNKDIYKILPSAANGVPGFGPVPRDTIMVKRKGQIRDWPK
jgi:hypothetical protein